MKEIKFIAVANIESSVALRNDGKESGLVMFGLNT